jgi:hypothetical protein
MTGLTSFFNFLPKGRNSVIHYYLKQSNSFQLTSNSLMTFSSTQEATGNEICLIRTWEFEKIC